MRQRSLMFCAWLLVLTAGASAAGTGEPRRSRPGRDAPRGEATFVVSWTDASPPPAPRFPSLRFDAGVPRAEAGPDLWRAVAHIEFRSADGQGQARAKVFVYSDAYKTRAKIHHLASFAILPLFGVQAVVGQQMFNNPSKATGTRRTVHRAVGYAIGGLFGLNSVTGLWNLIESRQDPSAGMRRVIHGVLMLVADAGFVATAFTRPNSHTAEGLVIYDAKKNQHLALAYASVSVATVGYLIMLLR
jgi:hypothetical protein